MDDAPLHLAVGIDRTDGFHESFQTVYTEQIDVQNSPAFEVVQHTLVVIAGIKLASKEADKEDPCGRERMECVAAIVVAMVLFMIGLGIGSGVLKNILSGSYGDLRIPGVLALVAAVVSIAVKDAMFWYTKINAVKIDSSALLTEAWHHRSGALSSVGALIGIAGARLGFSVMDSIASLVIFVFIVKAAYDIFKDAVNKMVDHSYDEETNVHFLTRPVSAFSIRPVYTFSGL